MAVCVDVSKPQAVRPSSLLPSADILDRRLSLGGNRFAHVPEEIGQLTPLVFLSLRGQPASLPSSLSLLTNLRTSATLPFSPLSLTFPSLHLSNNPDLPAHLQRDTYENRHASQALIADIVIFNNRIIAARAATITWLCVARFSSNHRMHQDPARCIADHVYSTRHTAVWDAKDANESN